MVVQATFAQLGSVERSHLSTEPVFVLGYCQRKYQSAETTDITKTVASGDNEIGVEIPEAADGEEAETDQESEE
ncbi:MAG TPA: hypothetical protein VFI31_14570 [Pirellulales bacterium]|nr:hypothetical protein [Pirellulales bacterium]